MRGCIGATGSWPSRRRPSSSARRHDVGGTAKLASRNRPAKCSPAAAPVSRSRSTDPELPPSVEQSCRRTCPGALGDLTRRQPLPVVDVAEDVLHELLVGDAAVASGIANDRDLLLAPEASAWRAGLGAPATCRPNAGSTRRNAKSGPDESSICQDLYNPELELTSSSRLLEEINRHRSALPLASRAKSEALPEAASERQRDMPVRDERFAVRPASRCRRIGRSEGRPPRSVRPPAPRAADASRRPRVSTRHTALALSAKFEPGRPIDHRQHRPAHAQHDIADRLPDGRARVAHRAQRPARTYGGDGAAGSRAPQSPGPARASALCRLDVLGQLAIGAAEVRRQLFDPCVEVYMAELRPGWLMCGRDCGFRSGFQVQGLGRVKGAGSGPWSARSANEERRSAAMNAALERPDLTRNQGQNQEPGTLNRDFHSLVLSSTYA